MSSSRLFNKIVRTQKRKSQEGAGKYPKASNGERGAKWRDANQKSGEHGK